MWMMALNISMLTRIPVCFAHHRCIFTNAGYPKFLTQIDSNLPLVYMDYDLRTVMRRDFDTISREGIIIQVISGLHYMHSAGILHGQLSPSNILMDEEGNVRICGFGTAREIPCDGNIIETWPCLRYYKAPELLLGQKHGS